MPLIGLGFVIVVCIVANALFTGTLSMVDGRFGSRAVWLVPFFALLALFRWQGPEEPYSCGYRRGPRDNSMSMWI